MSTCNHKLCGERNKWGNELMGGGQLNIEGEENTGYL